MCADRVRARAERCPGGRGTQSPASWRLPAQDDKDSQGMWAGVWQGLRMPLRSTCLSEDLQGRGSEDLESLQDRREKANLG